MNLDKLFSNVLSTYAVIVAINKLQEQNTYRGEEHLKISTSISVLSEMLENKLEKLVFEINKYL